jgi:predicted TIM-barrel fold metal-dependent hydrolase
MAVVSEPFQGLEEPVRPEGILANAARDAQRNRLTDYLVVDCDAHHYEGLTMANLLPYIDHPSIRRRMEFSLERSGSGRRFNLLPSILGNQDISGRLRRYATGNGVPDEPGVSVELSRFRYAMRQMGVDYALMYPTNMLHIGVHPDVQVEVTVLNAYARWITECVLPQDPTIKTMLLLPFNDAAASVRMVEQFSEKPGVVGFMVSSLRDQMVHHNKYMKVYAALEERGMPLAFHGVSDWQHPTQKLFNRFLTVHALGFPIYNMIHMMNLVINGIPQRFPKLRFIFMECGVCWLPFVMYRLDNEYMMRPSEAPLLEKKPSEYIREFFFTTQPLESTDRPEFLHSIFEMIHGETQLLYASDYPHWDFDLPVSILNLPFLSEQGKRRILGENARELFGLEDPRAAANA